MFEEGFSEEDVLWDPDVRESEERLRNRLRTALDKVFSTDPSTCNVFLYYANRDGVLIHDY